MTTYILKGGVRGSWHVQAKREIVANQIPWTMYKKSTTDFVLNMVNVGYKKIGFL